MHPFEETISVAGGIAAAGVLAIIVLTLFYRTLSWLSGAGSKPETVAVRGVLKKNTFATVHLAGGDTFDRVRLVGFTNSQTLKTHLPHELNSMVILEDEQGQRYLVRARDVRRIVIAPEAETS